VHKKPPISLPQLTPFYDLKSSTNFLSRLLFWVLYVTRLLENNRCLLAARRWTFRILLITLFAVALNHAARFTPSASILFLLYCAAALLLSIPHAPTEVLVAIVRRPMLSMLNTHRCIVLVSAILTCGWDYHRFVGLVIP